MLYSYEVEKKYCLTENGLAELMKIKDYVENLLNESGAFKMQNAWKCLGGYECWQAMALIDKLVELGTIKEITTPGRAQDRIFVRGEK